MLEEDGRTAPAPKRLWRNPEPKRVYDVVIVGGGGHGLATAYYLARNHGITNVAVLERGWLAGGNMARNTTVIRSNYLGDESAAIYEHSLRLWESLSQELDYDILFSQRGVLSLVHTLGDRRESMRRVNANRLNGIDAEVLTPRRSRHSVRSSTSPRTCATPSSAARYSDEGASRNTTTSPGRSRARPMRWAST